MKEKGGKKFPTGTIVKIFLRRKLLHSSLIRSSNSLLPPLRLNLSLRLWIYFFLSVAVPLRPAQTSRIMTLLTVKLPAADMTGLIIVFSLLFMSHWHCYCCCGSWLRLLLFSVSCKTVETQYTVRRIFRHHFYDIFVFWLFAVEHICGADSKF